MDKQAEEEVQNEAEFDLQVYLSRIDKNLHADEVIKYFGISRILDEIGVNDCIDHFGEDVVLREIGEASAARYFANPDDYRD